MVERFRDEIGDWRLCILSPFGGRVHSAWGLALAAKIRNERDLEADAIWSDDGIVIHLPDADEPPPADLVLIEPDEIEDLIVAELSGSALFGARFRENAARSLLIPRAYPGKRTPLWQQRLKSQSLLEVARDFPRFPVILETYRECLQDVLDLPALGDLLRKLHSRQISLVEVETPTASPFASSLLFDYVATYMYEGDTPERRAAGGGAGPRPRPAARAARPGGAARADRPRGAGRGRGAAAAPHRGRPGRRPRRPAAAAAQPRRPDRGGVRASGSTEGYSAASMLEKLVAERRVAKVRHRRRGALHRRRGRRPLPRRARRCRLRPGCRRASSRTTRTRCAPWSAATPAPTARSRPRALPRATASMPRRLCASSSAKGRW